MSILKESPKHETTYVTISRDEYESMVRTIGVLSDKELMRQVRASKKAKSRSFKRVAKELGI